MTDPEHVLAGDQSAADFNAYAAAKMSPAAKAAADAKAPPPQASDYAPAGGGPPTGIPPPPIPVVGDKPEQGALALPGRPGAVDSLALKGIKIAPQGDDSASQSAAMKLLQTKQQTASDPMQQPIDVSYLPMPTDKQRAEFDAKDTGGLPMPNSVEHGMATFDYSQSPLRHFMSEENARALVRASLTQDQQKGVFNRSMEEAGLFFLSQNIKNHMSTALSAIGSEKSWEQLAKEYGDQRKAENAAAPVSHLAGQVAGVTGTVGTGAALLPAEFWPAAASAATKATQAALPYVKQGITGLIKGGLMASGAGGVYKFGKWMGWIK